MTALSSRSVAPAASAHAPGPSIAAGMAAPAPAPARALGSTRRRRLTAIAGGVLAALSLPPLPLWPLAPIGIALLFVALSGARTPREAGWLGWWFGFVHFGLLLYWMAAALFVDIGQYWWVVPISVLGAPAALALLGLALGQILARLHGRTGAGSLRSAAVLAVAWVVLETVRGTALTGFPWMAIGYATLGWLPLAASAAWVGLAGQSLILATLGGVLGHGLWRLLHRPSLPGQQRAAVTTLAAVTLATALWAVAGSARLMTVTPAVPPDPAAPLLRLVQPNIDQSQKWDRALAASHFRQLLALSRNDGRVTAILWPETAPPFYLEWSDAFRPAMEAIDALLSPGQMLITGAMRRSPEPGVDGAAAETTGDTAERRYYNALVAFDDRGQRIAVYDKAHLVPFGEYMPFGDLLPVGPVAAGNLQFSAGPGPSTLRVPGLPAFAPSICYEIIFPGAVMDRGDPADWLLTVTNDGWFGRTLGPHQHFHMARLRAIEEGRPMVRVANTGISGVVDVAGRIVASLPLGAAGAVDVPLPAPLNGQTLLQRTEPWPVAIIALLMLAMGLTRRRRRPAKPNTARGQGQPGQA